MEFNFHLNDIVPYDITVYDYNLNILSPVSLDENDSKVLTRYYSEIFA
jgi:hypothetical protein